MESTYFDYVSLVKSPLSKASTQNPKDLLGCKKPSFTKIPMVALAHESLAMMDGADKYGAFNWRDKKVVASIYIDAAFRHLSAWFEGEEVASDSKVHHLGHARACLGILLDALETGNLIDDRPVNESSKGKLSGVMVRLSKVIEEKAAEKANKEQNNLNGYIPAIGYAEVPHKDPMKTVAGSCERVNFNLCP